MKTIKNAISKYRTIYPIAGKRSLDDCFFFLRGEAFFQFKTKDKKVHSIKASITRPVMEATYFNREMLSYIVKIINQPILIRSLFFRKYRRYTGISALCNSSDLQRLLHA